MINVIEDSKERCADIALHYGEDEQQKIMIEEAAELTQAICKIQRKGRNSNVRSNYIEELADVTIMAEQLFSLLDDKEKNDFKFFVEYKLERQLRRMEES